MCKQKIAFYVFAELTSDPLSSQAEQEITVVCRLL